MWGNFIVLVLHILGAAGIGLAILFSLAMLLRFINHLV